MLSIRQILADLLAFFMQPSGVQFVKLKDDGTYETEEASPSEIVDFFLLAVTNDNHKAVEKLVAPGHVEVDHLFTDFCQFPVTALFIAAYRGHHRVVDSLIRANADVDFQATPNGPSVIAVATMHGQCQVVALLIKAGANLDDDRAGYPLLYAAAQNGQIEMVDLFIKAQVDLDAIEADRDRTAIYIAAASGHHRIVDLLIKAQANVDLPQNINESPVLVAASRGHAHCVDLLIRAQADLNHVQILNCSPLFCAVKEGHFQLAISLIKAGADVNLSNQQGMSPLHLAAKACEKVKSHQLVRWLVDAGAAVNATCADGATPIYMASSVGQSQTAQLLIDFGADADLAASNGRTPLYAAAENGHKEVVLILIKSGANALQKAHNGNTALDAASQFRHFEVVAALRNLTDESGKSLVIPETYSDLDNGQQTKIPTSATEEWKSDSALSQQLHESLTKAGFVESRAALQSAVSDVLEKIQRDRYGINDIFIVGSFSEGWGNSLTTLDGRTDVESDIDIMKLLQGRLYHLKDICKCRDNEATPVEYRNGHIFCPGFASNPAVASDGLVLRPAMDKVDACRLCCYPPIAPLQPDRIRSSNIPKVVLQSLQSELASSPCHVVHATSPGLAGEQLRVSTTFLERRLIRSFTTLQGQLFVTLKYLVKKVLCHDTGFQVQGLKAYHVKTVTFRMLEETPAEQWKPENLVNLIRKSLSLLLDCVHSGINSGSANCRFMDHFFLCSADLYLKSVDGSSPETMRLVLESAAGALQNVLQSLPQVLHKFMNDLKPISDSGLFYFHPFLTLPYLVRNNLSVAGRFEYHEIYDAVHQAIRLLSQTDCSIGCQADLVMLLGRLPDCARTARETLRTLTCLKFGYPEAAQKIVSSCGEYNVSRGIEWSPDRSASEATTKAVWKYLLSGDSAWKFCLSFFPRPELNFMPNLVECFPEQAPKDIEKHFINFNALLLNLRVVLTDDYFGASTKDWIRDVAYRQDVDTQDMASALVNCSVDDPEGSMLFKILFDRINSNCSLTVLQWVHDEMLAGFVRMNNSD